MKSIYIHIPFCLSKCRYCGFNSVPLADRAEAERYCRAIDLEIENTEIPIPQIETLYLGGGTPTAIAVVLIDGILSKLAKRSGFGAAAEITIEANPETLDAEKLTALRSLGFNRLSLGVQSFDDRLLELLGRPHDSRQAISAYERARGVGFQNIGLDLIYGLPGQSLIQWQRDLKIAADLGPEHISAYSLTYEPGTEFVLWRSQGRIEPCSEDLEAEMFVLGHEHLAAFGYEHYEVSNYARPGYRSRHNLNYWRCGDYLGFGAGASSHHQGRRWTNVSHWRQYVTRMESHQSPISSLEELDPKQRIFEAIFLGLRMFAGIAISEFEARWGRHPKEYQPEAWERLEKDGYLKTENGRLYLTLQGMMIADLLLSNLAP